MLEWNTLLSVAVVCFSISFLGLGAQALMATYVLWLNKDAPMIEANKNV